MHYYKRNLGDYAKKAGRLSMLQHGAYTLLLDACYDRERFPTEEDAIEWTWASSPEEVQAVKFVLSRFFELQEDKTYVQTRVYDEVQVYKVGEIQNRLIALAREGRKQKRDDFVKDCDQLRAEIKNDPLSKSHATWTDLVEALIKMHEPPPNHKPLTTNQEPRTNIKPIPSTSEKSESDSKKEDPDESPPDQPKEKKSKSKSKFKFNDEQYQIAVEMSCPSKARFDETLKINLDEWADTVRKLMDTDGYTREQIQYLWRTIHDNSLQFDWQSNCRTPMKLRLRKDGLSYFEIIANQIVTQKRKPKADPERGFVEKHTDPSWREGLLDSVVHTQQSGEELCHE